MIKIWWYNYAKSNSRGIGEKNKKLKNTPKLVGNRGYVNIFYITQGEMDYEEI
jgi:hypothetical protein